MPTTIEEWDALLEPKFKMVTFHDITNIVPENWHSWFFGRISENAPFSWGDNNRTLITMDRLIPHLEDTFDASELEEYGVTKEEWYSYIEYLASFTPMTYVDLEN
jgi:hypothetical protein